MAFLEVNHLTKALGGRVVVDDVIIFVQEGQTIGLIGETGSGKSTLLKLIAGMLASDTGEININGERVAGPDERLLPGHSSIGYLSQFFELRNHYRVEEELDYSNMMSQGEASAIFSVCKIDHLLSRWTNEVSGGERQRVVLAKKLISKPSLLLLDEPFSNLDLIHKNILRNVLDDLKEKLGLTIILASHDPHDILSWAEEIIVLQNGKIVERDTPSTLYIHPATMYTASLLGLVNAVSDNLATRLSITSRFQTGEYFLRPEWIRINTDNSPGIPAIISGMIFAGPYFIVTVKVHDEMLVVHSVENIWTIGERVMLSVLNNSTA